MQLDTRRFGFGRACQLREFGNLAIVDCIHASGTPRDEWVTMVRRWRPSHTALRFANLLEFGPSAATVERLSGDSRAASMLRETAKFN